MDAVNRAVGRRVRSARQACGWSLLDVEERSDGAFKASVVGAYERGERALSVSRLVGLAELYGVAPSTLLPEPSAGAEAGVLLDLDAVDTLPDDQAALVDRYLEAIGSMRAGGLGPGRPVRASDLQVLAALLSGEPAFADHDE